MSLFSVLYALLSTALLLCLLPLLPLIACREKYRHRMLHRLGFGLAARLRALSPLPAGTPTIWIHALSVGEVTSALPLVRGLRDHFPQARIIFSATTRAGNQVVDRLLSSLVDATIAAPLDLGPVVPIFIRSLRPDLFILVETDFWPHWLHCLAQRNIPTLLVNGRISAPSFARYRRFAWLFRPMFQTLTLLSMQTKADTDKMIALGLDPQQVTTLGNLKFDTSLLTEHQESGGDIVWLKQRYGFSAAAPLWICGSTHPGEEELIFHTYQQLLCDIPDLHLLIAPRNIERTEEIVALGKEHQLACRRWTRDKTTQGPVLILDTIGELVGCYPMAEVVFIGGSLAPFGGHNPIEPAAASVPVLFGPHMEDFSEIAAELIHCGGAQQIDSVDTLRASLHRLLTDPVAHHAMAKAAGLCVQANQGVVRSHLQVISDLLAGRARNR
jgi:3-deoxy-D-manno-octulosonic-acid transferase